MSTLLTLALLTLPASLPCPPAPHTGTPAGSPDAITLVFAPPEDTVIRRTFDSQATYTLDEIDLNLDGEQPPMELPEPDLTILATEHIVVTDTLGVVEEGRPDQLTRSFDELSWTTTFSSGLQEEDGYQEDVCDLEDETVEFIWDEEEEEFLIRGAEESELDEALLEHLEEDMDLVSFLPEDEVDIDESWELTQAAYLALVWPGGVLLAHEEDGEVDLVQLEMSLALIEGTEFEGQATLEEITEEDGQSLAWISFEMEITSDASVDVDVEEGDMTLRRTIERTLQGRLAWDLEAGHALSLEATAETELVTTTTQTVFDPEGDEHELEQVQSFSGEVEYEVTFEAE